MDNEGVFDLGDFTLECGSVLPNARVGYKAKAVVMAGQTDLYFTPADVADDASCIPGARYRVIPSLWGHLAGTGLEPADAHFIQAEIQALLAAQHTNL